MFTEKLLKNDNLVDNIYIMRSYLIKSIVLFFLFSVTIQLFSQSKYLVYLKDKENVSSFNIEQMLSERAVKNHHKNKVVFNEYDLPLNYNYITQLNSYGQVLKSSKWLNAVIYSTTKSEQEIADLPFVKKVHELTSYPSSSYNKFKSEEIASTKILNYDSTEKQNLQVGVDCLHDNGFLGEDILVAIIDAGFEGMNTISAFDSLYLENRVVDQFNFIDNDVGVYERSAHGTMVSSVIAGNQTGFIGAAPHVKICLYITEDVAVEVHEEEFDLVRGLERADSVGADIANISLGYFNFDTLQGNYQYVDMDGETTIAAKGIQIATSKGLLITVSAGNRGPDYIGTPCDADSILCVGATDSNNIYANFSSVGYSSDGRVKPDVAALGKEGVVVDNFGDIIRANGTSFSSPLVCGMTSCLIQAHPLRTMINVIDAVKQSASQFNTPDNLLGYGIPNACKADSILSYMDTILSVNEITRDLNISFYPNPTKDYLTVSSDAVIKSVKVFALDGRLVMEEFPNTNTIVLNCIVLKKGIYITSINNTSYIRFIKH